jgi:hypothetical protein
MVASNNFKQLSQVLSRLESSGTSIQHAEMDQDLSDTDKGVTAELAVSIPILTDENVRETTSIDAENITIEDGKVSADLTVTVSPNDSKDIEHVGTSHDHNNITDEAEKMTVPAYKNPDKLKSVYNQYNSFPEMTEALGVDVTSETVRRHMVEYDIHDPDDTKPGSYIDTGRSKKTDKHTDTAEPKHADPHSTLAESPTNADGEVDTAVNSERTNTSSNSNDDEVNPEATNAVADGGNVSVPSNTNQSSFATIPIRKLVSEGSSREHVDPTIETDIDIPEKLTVGELADAINQSQTVRGVTQCIGISRTTAKQLLQEFDLIDFVSHRLAADQITVSPDVVVRRINNSNQQ